MNISNIFAQVQKHEIQLEDEKGQPSFIQFAETKVSSELNSVKSFLRKQYQINPSIDFKVKSEQQHSEIKYQKLQQYYKGIKVMFGEMVVSSKKDNLKSLNGRFVEITDLNTTPQLTEQAALDAVLNQIGAIKYAWQDPVFEGMLKNERQNQTASNFPKGEIVIIEKNMFEEQPTPVLAYRFDIYTLNPLGRNEYYVDANNGEVVFTNPIMVHVQGTADTRYSGTRTIETEQSGASFRLRDLTRGSGITTWNADNLNVGDNYNTSVHFTDNNNNWTSAEFNNANNDNVALDAHWGAEMTYDYFWQRHNRNSIDNAGYALNNYVHLTNGALPWNNAGWDGQRMLYGDGDGATFSPLTSLDVIAHEIGHGFCSRTAGLIYQKEQGAINESLSDIWGAMVEFFAASDKQTYLIGEDICISADALRSMSTPNQFNQPDTYGGTNWFDVNSADPGNDHWGAHTNSGVMNLWFHLLAEGGSGTNDNGVNYSITSIGKLKAANIVYRAETTYFISTTNYLQARVATIQAAKDLYGATSAEATQVGLAWTAVGVVPPLPTSHTIVGPTQLTPGYVATYALSPYYNANNYVWTIPSGCATNYCWAILSGQGTTSITLRAGSTGTQTITCRAYYGNNLVASQYITVNVQIPNTGGETTPCLPIAPIYGVIYPPNPCNGGGLIAETMYFESIVIYDIFGRIVKQGIDVEQINVDDLPNGMYIIHATLNNNEIITQKLLK